jgi:superfamily I DNA and/or RNA helicase
VLLPISVPLKQTEFPPFDGRLINDLLLPLSTSPPTSPASTTSEVNLHNNLTPIAVYQNTMDRQFKDLIASLSTKNAENKNQQTEIEELKAENERLRTALSVCEQQHLQNEIGPRPNFMFSRCP